MFEPDAQLGSRKCSFSRRDCFSGGVWKNSQGTYRAHALQRRGAQGGWHVRMGGNGQRHHRLRRPVPRARKVGLSRNDEPGNPLARRGLRGRVFARKLGGDEEAAERSWRGRLAVERSVTVEGKVFDIKKFKKNHLNLFCCSN